MHKTLQGLFPLEVQTYSVELDRGLNLLPLIFFLLPPRLPEKDGLWLDLNIKNNCYVFKYTVFQVNAIHSTSPEHRISDHCAAFSCTQCTGATKSYHFPTRKKELDSLIRNVLLSVGRRGEELMKKNKSLQPGTTQYRIKVIWTDGFRMLPYTLPRVTPRSSIFTDVWNMFCVWNPFTPRMRKSIWPEIENVYILFKNIIKWMCWNQ